MEIYLIRHGESQGNIEKKYIGWTDSPLSEYGKNQCMELRESLDKVEFDLLLSSDLSRAQDTMKLILPDRKYCITKQFREINFGLFENMTYGEIKIKYPKEYELWNSNPSDYIFPYGESQEEFYSRIIEEIESLNLKNYKRVLIVSHGGVIRNLLSYFMYGKGKDGWKFSVENCRISVIEVEDDYSYLKCLNCK